MVPTLRAFPPGAQPSGRIFRRGLGCGATLHRPKLRERHGQEPRIAQRERAGAGMEQHPTPEILPALLGQPQQPAAVRLLHGGRSLDLHPPRLAATRHHEVHLNLILVPVMPEAQVRIRPSRLGNELLDHEGFQQVPEPIPAGVRQRLVPPASPPSRCRANAPWAF